MIVCLVGYGDPSDVRWLTGSYWLIGTVTLLLSIRVANGPVMARHLGPDRMLLYDDSTIVVSIAMMFLI